MIRLYFWGSIVGPFQFGVCCDEIGHGRVFYLDVGPFTIGLWISKEILDWN